MYVVVVGNLARIVGPFPDRASARAYADRFDITAEAYDPGRWEGYSVTIVALTAAPASGATAERQREAARLNR